MKNKKIADNPTFAKLNSSIEALEALNTIYQHIPFSKHIFPKLEKEFNKLEQLKTEKDKIINTPDIFNQNFASFGWIAYDSMDMNVMQEANELYNLKGINEAEQLLSDYYNEEKLNFEIKRFLYHPVLEKRYRLINLAKQDYIEERYHSCIPLLLSLMDGIVNDISKHVGFFAQQSDLSINGSVVGHGTGLPFLTFVMSKGRNKTTIEEITIPYRNGILHGRDLGFDTKLVASKTWGALFAIKDWGLEFKKKNNKNKETEETTPLLKSIQKYNQTQKYPKKISEWKPRLSKDYAHIPMINEFKTAPLNTPEQVVAEFIDNWKNKRYGLMVNSLLSYIEKPKSKKAGEIRNDFGHISPISYTITSVEDETSAISVVHTKITFKDEQLKIFPVRLVYNDKDNNILARFEHDGEWKIVQISFMDVLYQ